MNLVFLGTASCFPTPSRGVSCMALQFENSGDIWIFDCGEGSQIQIQKSRLKPGKVTKIFITHLHGDHMFGLPGFLCTLGNGGAENFKDKKIDIYGPLGLKKYVDISLQISQSPLPYQVQCHEIVPLDFQFVPDQERCPYHHEIDKNNSDLIHFNEERKCWTLIDQKNIKVIAGPILHRIPSFAFIIQESDQPGSLNVKKLEDLGVKPGPIYGQLKMGQSVTLASGEILKPEDVLGCPKKGKKVAILGDTNDTHHIEQLCQDCDLLIHEATMENNLKEKAVEYGHSTPEMAAQMALKVKAKRLVLTHLSPRYKPISLLQGDSRDENEKSAEILLHEARQTLGKECLLDIAEDFFELKV